ncbi:MAG: hypothetical protein LBM77_09840 [Spirochaetaceae bacterium]|jgi:hypothetical protein|nr:hypothetical protein [Spirochaetaceae bacterium]
MKNTEAYLILEDYRKGLFTHGLRISQETLEAEPKSLMSIKLERAEAPESLPKKINLQKINLPEKTDGATTYYKCKKEKKRYKSLDNPGEPFEIESRGADIVGNSSQVSLGESALVQFNGSLYCEETLQPLARVIDNYHISTHLTVEDGGILEVQGDAHLGKKATVMVHRGGRLVMQAGAHVGPGCRIEVGVGEIRVVGG